MPPSVSFPHLATVPKEYSVYSKLSYVVFILLSYIYFVSNSLRDSLEKQTGLFSVCLNICRQKEPSALVYGESLEWAAWVL